MILPRFRCSLHRHHHTAAISLTGLTLPPQPTLRSSPYTFRLMSSSSSSSSSPSAVRYLGAIDQGTSSSRFILYTTSGRVVDQHQLPVTSLHPNSTQAWTEQDPLHLLHTVQQCIDTVMQRHPSVSVSALGLTNQRETTLLWDRRTGEPVHNAIVWHDARTAELVQRIVREKGGRRGADVWRRETGLPVSTYFSALKLHWILHIAHTLPHEQRPSLSSSFLSKLQSQPSSSSSFSPSSPAFADLMFGTVDSWLVWNLTGGPNGGRHVTDVSNASRTLMMNIRTLQWHQPILEALGIPLHLLPAIRPSSSASAYGRVAAPSALAGCPITGCLGDQQAALLGQLCLRPGEVKSTYGTGCFLLLNTGSRIVESRRGLLSTVAYQLGENSKPAYALEGSVGVAGAAVQWLRDRVGIVESSRAMDAVAGAVPDAHGLYFVPAFSGLLSPYYRSDARGLMIGITHSTNRSHIARATLDAAAYQTATILQAMTADAALPVASVRVDGGMAASDILCQMLADLLAVEVRRGPLECTAAGAAYAAGLGAGVWSGVDAMRQELERGRQADEGERVFVSRISAEERQRLMRGWDRAVERSVGWVEKTNEQQHDRDSSQRRRSKRNTAAAAAAGNQPPVSKL